MRYSPRALNGNLKTSWLLPSYASSAALPVALGCESFSGGKRRSKAGSTVTRFAATVPFTSRAEQEATCVAVAAIVGASGQGTTVLTWTILSVFGEDPDAAIGALSAILAAPEFRNDNVTSATTADAFFKRTFNPTLPR